MAFAFFRGALPHAADNRADAPCAAAMLAQDAISVPTALTENSESAWFFDPAATPARNDLWPLGVRLSLLGGLSLASWGLVLGAGYALRAAMA